MADMRHGTATALLANINRNSEARPEPFAAGNFIHWGELGEHEDEEEPTMLDDPIAQSNLIRAAMFGIGPR